jgi:putative transcriptional regulator
MASGHAPTELIAGYAAGALPHGMRLLVASHLSFCPACRDRVARLEAVGGALLAEGPPVEPTPACLERALARIADRGAGEPPAAPAEPLLPQPLCRCVGRPLRDLAWRPMAPGLSACRLDGFEPERVGLVRGEPGVALHPLTGALVLAGRLDDAAGSYGRGDLAFGTDDGAGPEVTGLERCLCLVIRPGQRRNDS